MFERGHGQVVSAEALRLVVLLKNTETVEGGAYVDPIPDAWELEFIDVGQVKNKGHTYVVLLAPKDLLLHM